MSIGSGSFWIHILDQPLIRPFTFSCSVVHLLCLLSYPIISCSGRLRLDNFFWQPNEMTCSTEEETKFGHKFGLIANTDSLEHMLIISGLPVCQAVYTSYFSSCSDVKLCFQWSRLKSEKSSLSYVLAVIFIPLAQLSSWDVFLAEVISFAVAWTRSIIMSVTLETDVWENNTKVLYFNANLAKADWWRSWISWNIKAILCWIWISRHSNSM